MVVHLLARRLLHAFGNLSENFRRVSGIKRSARCKGETINPSLIMSTSTLPSSPAQHSPTSLANFKMPTVTPHLVCAGADQAIEFYKKAFGAKEMMRLAGPDGKLIHASVVIGDSIVMMADEMPTMGSFGPKTLKGSPVTIHLQVDDADALQRQAISAGATLIMPVAEMFWGDRYGMVEDPYGHRWSVGTHVRDVSPAEMQKAALSMSCGG